MSRRYVKSIGLSEKHKRRIKKRILYLRDEANPSISWYRLGRRFHMASSTVQKIYQEAKSEQEKRKKKQA